MFIFLLFLVFMNLKSNLLGICFHCQFFLLNCKIKPSSSASLICSTSLPFLPAQKTLLTGPCGIDSPKSSVVLNMLSCSLFSCVFNTEKKISFVT